METQDLGEWKGLDKKGNCFFKFDFTDKSINQKIKLRVPSEVGFELVLLMRTQLIKFMGEDRRMNTLLNSAEKLEFNKLKEALVDNKDLIEKFSLKKSIKYNVDYFDSIGKKISEIELQQEENLVKDMDLQKKLQKQQHQLLLEER